MTRYEMRDTRKEKLRINYPLSAVCYLLFAICYLLFACPLHAINPQTWMKKAGQQKPRKITQKQATVAAVRGVDEPSQVDPNARNYEAANQMEKKIIPPERVAQFMSEGNLKKTEIQNPKPADSADKSGGTEGGKQ